MEKFLSDFENKTKLFLGDTDSFSIKEYNLTIDGISENLLLATLIYDVVLFPAAYSWQSNEMAEVIHRNQALIISERAIPVIRNFLDTRDVKDYYDKRKEETEKQINLDIYKDPSLNTELVKKENKKDMEFTYGLNSYMHLEDISVKEAFIKLYRTDLKDCYDDRSLYMIIQRLHCNAEQKERFRQILSNDVDYDNFSRSTVLDFINNRHFSKDIEHRLRRRISNLYLLANAIAANADFYISIENKTEQVNYSNLHMHRKILNAVGLTNDVFKKMTATDVLRIVYSDEYKIFISYYRDLIFELKETNKTMKADMIKHKLEKKIEIQSTIQPYYKAASFVGGLSTSLLVGLITNVISGSQGSLMAFGMGAAGGFTLGNYIIDRIKQTNYQISSIGYMKFKEYIINEIYKTELHISIKDVIL